MGRKYTPEIAKFIKDNVRGTPIRDLTELVNKKFNTDFTYYSVKSFLERNKLRNGRPNNRPKGHSRLFPPEIQKFMRDNQVGVSGMNMAALVNAEFGTTYTPQQTDSYYGNHGLHSGLTGCFPKGNVPFNKGKKGISYPGMEATQFKPGQMPQTHKPVGTELIRPDGYTWVKIADPKTWRQKHLLIWEAANGPVPKDHCVLFLNGDKQDVRLENFALVSRAQLAVLNQFKLISRDPDATKAGIIIADIILKITERRKNK